MGMQGTRNNQSMFEEIGALERAARLYQIIGNAELRDVYTLNRDRLAMTINELLTLPLDAESHAEARALLAEAEPAVDRSESHGPTRRAWRKSSTAFPHLSEMASQGLEPHQHPNRLAN